MWIHIRVYTQWLESVKGTQGKRYGYIKTAKEKWVKSKQLSNETSMLTLPWRQQRKTLPTSGSAKTIKWLTRKSYESSQHACILYRCMHIRKNLLLLRAMYVCCVFFILLKTKCCTCCALGSNWFCSLLFYALPTLNDEYTHTLTHSVYLWEDTGYEGRWLYINSWTRQRQRLTRAGWLAARLILLKLIS